MAYANTFAYIAGCAMTSLRRFLLYKLAGLVGGAAAGILVGLLASLLVGHPDFDFPVAGFFGGFIGALLGVSLAGGRVGYVGGSVLAGALVGIGYTPHPKHGPAGALVGILLGLAAGVALEVRYHGRPYP